jgi:hypothetical protein
MKNLGLKVLHVGHVAAVVIVLLALLVSQAGYACGLYSDGLAASDRVVIRPAFAQLMSIPEATDESMTPSQGATLPQAARLIMVPLRFENPESRQWQLDSGIPLCRNVYDSNESEIPLSATRSLISSELGRQFTLVGAKPSGTS